MKREELAQELYQIQAALGCYLRGLQQRGVQGLSAGGWEAPAWSPAFPPAEPAAAGSSPAAATPTPPVAPPAPPVRRPPPPPRPVPSQAFRSKWSSRGRPPAQQESSDSAAKDAESRHQTQLIALRERIIACDQCELSREELSGGSSKPRVVVLDPPPRDDEHYSMFAKMREHVLKVPAESVFELPVTRGGGGGSAPAQCREHLFQLIRQLNPKCVLVFGGLAAALLMGRSLREIAGMRGRWLQWEGIPTMMTFHPRWLAQHPERKRDAFEDLKVLQARLHTLG